jgi:hypothetical protein
MNTSQSNVKMEMLLLNRGDGEMTKIKLKNGSTIESIGHNDIIRASLKGDLADEIVFMIHCNDNLMELPVTVLKQMKNHIGSIIKTKENL